MSNPLASIKPVSKDLLYMKVADAINNYIHQNHLGPGDKIPSERVLAEQFETGRNSVREALRVLENEGIIAVKTGRGAFVAERSTDSIYFRLMKVNFLELLELKTILEQAAVRRLTRSATPEQLHQLEKLLQVMERDAADGIYSVANDRQFHKQIWEFSGNKLLVQLVGNMVDALDSYENELEDPSDIWLSTVPLHREMLDAIKDHDEQRACAAYDRILDVDMSVFNQFVSTQ